MDDSEEDFYEDDFLYDDYEAEDGYDRESFEGWACL